MPKAQTQSTPEKPASPGEMVVGIDLGATIVRLGAFDPCGALLVSQEAEIRAQEGWPAGLERIARLITALISSQNVAGRGLLGVGIGSTGPTDSIRGFLINPETMPGWLNVPIVPFLKDRFQVPVCLENDADAAALGEYWQGAGRPASPEDPPVRRLYAVTVGTGVGTAFIYEGHVVRGAIGYHPEGGHMVVDPSGPECYCGGRGCLESLCSGTAIGLKARQALESSPETGAKLRALAGGPISNVTARLVADAARQGDQLSKRVIGEAARSFATGLFNILMLFYPELILLSGGVMRSSDLFMPAIQEMLLSASKYMPIEPVRILPSSLGYFAGVYGAAYALLQSLDHPCLEIRPGRWNPS